MEWLHQAIDFFLHLDKHLGDILQTYGTLTYFIVFGIIFCETGLVVTPILPGDSLLFAAGAFAGLGALNIFVLYPLVILAALAGDNANYWIGRYLGPKVFYQKNGTFLNKKYLDRTHAFYEKYGVLAIIFGQFIPIIRTFVPFVAGIGKMNYGTFVGFNLAAVLIWTTLFTWGGYFFGNQPWIHDHFHYVVLGIIFVSILPILYEICRVWLMKPGKKKKR
jgi:membrane-associated protein